MANLSAKQVLARVSENLGYPRIRVMNPEASLDEVGLRWNPGRGGLMVWLVDQELVAAVVALAESASQVTEIEVAQVFEGMLVIARVTSASRKRSTPLPRSPVPWPIVPKRRCRKQTDHKIATVAKPLLDRPRLPKRRIAPSWVPGALAGELVLPAGLDRDDVTVEVDGVRVCRPEGLVVFGRRPQLFLPGMAVLASGPCDRRFVGSLLAVIDAVGEWTPSTMDSRILRAAVLFALTRRSWDPDDRALPNTLELGERLVVHFPPGGSDLAPQLAVIAGHSRDPLLDIEVWGGCPRHRDGVLTVGLPALQKQVYVSASAREECVLSALGTGSRSTSELLGELGWTRSTLRRVLAGMVERGVLEQACRTPQAPGQRYSVRVHRVED